MKLTRLCVASTLAIGALLLSGCSAGASVEKGNQLTVVVGDKFDNFDSTSLAGSDSHGNVLRQLYDTLTMQDENHTTQPRLAESWTVSPDGTTIDLRLRPGLKFSDGSALSAKDVVWNVEHALKEDTAATIRPLLEFVSSVTAPDDVSVRLTFTHAMAAPFDILDYLFIAKPQASDEALKNKPIGTGPFILSSWNPASEAVLIKNPHYWNPDEPKTNKIIFKISSDTQAATLMFKSGQADVLATSTWRDFAAFKKQSDVTTLIGGDGGSVASLMFNTKQAPFDDPRVRTAIALTLDRSEIIHAVYADQTKPWCLPWPKGTIGFDVDPDLARNCEPQIAEAKKLLAEAGYPNGLTVDLITVDGDFTQVSQVVAQQLTQIGVTLKVTTLELSVFLDKAFAGEWSTLVVDINRLAHDSGVSMLLGVPLQNGGVTNFSSSEYQTLIDGIVFQPPGGNRDEAMKSMNRFLLAQNFVVPITSQDRHYVLGKNVTGVATNLDGYLVLGNAASGS